MSRHGLLSSTRRACDSGSDGLGGRRASRGTREEPCTAASAPAQSERDETGARLQGRRIREHVVFECATPFSETTITDAKVRLSLCLSD